jgi:hypothetical protein
LTARGIETPAGGRTWNPSQVLRILKRASRQISSESVNF